VRLAAATACCAHAAVIGTGDINSELYLLQQGRVSAYAPRENGLVRLQSLRAGAFINEDALYLDAPQPNTVVTDVRCCGQHGILGRPAGIPG
jgi:CRP-like cAMP-binding protein